MKLLEKRTNDSPRELNLPRPALSSHAPIHRILYHDATTGLIDNRGRPYHPQFGRFLTTDPQGYRFSLNLYEYLNSNPNRYVDPSGEGPILTVAIAAAVVLTVNEVAFAPGPDLTDEEMREIQKAQAQQNLSNVATILSLPAGGFGYKVGASIVAKKLSTSPLARIVGGSLLAGPVEVGTRDAITGDIANYPENPGGAAGRMGMSSAAWLLGGVLTGPGQLASSGPKCWRYTVRAHGGGGSGRRGLRGLFSEGKGHTTITVERAGGRSTSADFAGDITPGMGRWGPPSGRLSAPRIVGEGRLTREQAKRLFNELERLKRDQISIPFRKISSPLGPGANCTTAICQAMNRTGSGSFGLLGPSGPGQVGLLPGLSNSAPFTRAAPPAAKALFWEIDATRQK